MYEDLTNMQIKIIDFIKETVYKKGYPPSVREIGKYVGLASTSSVHYQLNKLEKKGYIKRDSLKQRALEIVNNNIDYAQKQDVVNVPIIGNVAAGSPILAEENIEDTFPLPESFLGKGECFMLNVKGESMIDAGILDGDLVIVRKQNAVKNGEIIVALLDNEATVKTFYKEDNCFRLQPENSLMEPIYTAELSVAGKVIGIIRRMQ